MLSFRRLHKLFAFCLLISSSLLISNKLEAATVSFSKLYKASTNTSNGGPLYSVEDVKEYAIFNIVGTNFKFTSANPGDATFSGNNILGTLSYNDASGAAVSIVGIISRPDKSGSTPLAVNFTATSDRTVRGEAYALIIAGHESGYVDGMDFTTSSDPIATVLNNLLTSPSIINTGTLSPMTACAGSNSAEQTFTISASYLSANLVVTAPTGYEVSKTTSTGFASSISYTPASGTVASTTVYVRLKNNATNGATGNITCTSTNAATKYIATGIAVVSTVPTISIGAITAVSTSATSFSIPYTVTAGTANQYSLVASTPAMTGFSAITSATLPSSPISVTIPASAGGSYGFSLTIKNSTSNCATSYSIALSVSDLNPGTIAADQTICTGSTPAVLTSTAASTGGTGTITYEWYVSTTSTTSGFTAIASSNSLTYAPGALTQTTYYYRKATDASGTPKSGNSNVITITVNELPSISATTDGARCGTGTVDLGATASAGTINWYAAATGGSSLATGTTYTTPSIAATTIYYVSATNGTCTTATRTPVTATINAIPTIAGTTPAANCGTGTVTLGATASAGTINWYADALGGSSLGTGTTFTTPSIAATTTYYVDATNGDCITATRTAVIATINAIPTISGTTPAARCGTGTVDLGAAASAGTINWYAALTGGSSLGTGATFTTPSIAATTTYYVDATVGACTTGTRTAVIATINAIPTISGTTTAARCGTGTVDLAAAASAGTINWYAAATGGSSLGTGTTFTTPSLSATTTFYVDATSGSCTSATRTAVAATVNAIPTISGTTPAARCGTGTVDLAAAASAGTINWYADATGGSSLGTGTTFTTPSIAATTTYYVDATSGSCTTGTRTAVAATVNAIPTISGTTPAARCGTGTVDLGAAASAGTINWYAAATGGSSLGTGTTFTTPSIAATTTYYVDATSGSCTTGTRTAVAATVNAIPTISGTTPAARCGTGTVDLAAAASAGTINWYAAATGGSSLGTGTTFTTPSIAATTTYYVDATSGSCTTGTRTAVAATVNAIPTISGTTPSSRCAVGTVTLGATASAGTINWYAAATGGTSLGTGATFTTPSLSATTTYYVDATSGSCTTGSRTAVTATLTNCLSPDINATNVNVPVTGSVTSNDKILPGSTYGTPIPASTNPAGATITINSSGTYTFTAPLPGKYIFYIPVCASGQTTGCPIMPLEISVTDPNSTTNPPIAKNDYAATSVNTPAVVKVLSNDKPANTGTVLVPSTVKVNTAPVNGTAVVNTTTGVITYTPTTGFVGTDSLVYNVCDNSSPTYCQIATVYFKISATAIAETTTPDDDFNKVDINTNATGNVLTNDVNSAGNTLKVTSFNAPLASQGTIVINADGSYVFTPKLNFFGPVDIIYTACTSTTPAVCGTATLHILVSPVIPPAPKPIHGTYTSNAPTNPATIAPTVTNIPAGCKVIYCNVNGLSCASTAPALPTIPGIYVWCVKSLDTLTGLTSTPCVYDTLRILPVVTTVNATYLNGVAANPKNISPLVTSISGGSNPKWCDATGNNCSTTAPVLPTKSGTYIWCVKAVDIVSGLESANCVMDTVNILDPYTALEITKSARGAKLNPDGSVLVTFAMKATNKTDVILDSVTIKDNLAATFNSFVGFSVYSVQTFGGLVRNAGYDGIANIDLVSSQSKINPKSTDSLILKVLVSSSNIAGSFLNTSILSGKSKYGVISVNSNDPGVNASDTARRAPTPFVLPTTDIIIAGGFSPNQDGFNDNWIIVRPFGTTIEVKVFNRWGNIVYENGDYKNDWNGKGQKNFSGSYVPEGTYFYIVNAIDRAGNIKKFTSSLTIVR